jgi:hypothetical protein
MRTFLMFAASAAAAAGLTACGQSEQNAAGNAAANASASTAAAAKPKHPTYCFYKDANTKGWSAARDKSGNVTVKGKAYLADAAYSGSLIQGEVEGEKASIWLTMSPNTTGYAKPDGWWDVSATIPGSAAAKSVVVMCGTKTVATLPVK